jgi:hypothetical protein
MDNKNFCEAHWGGPLGKLADVRETAGERTAIIRPDPGQACSFCEEPATHCGPFEPKAHEAHPNAALRKVAEEQAHAMQKRKSVRP